MSDTARERALELVKEIDELARSDNTVQFGLVRHHYAQYADLITAALREAEAPVAVCSECRVLDAKYVDARSEKQSAEDDRDHYEKLWHIAKREHATAIKERDEAMAVPVWSSERPKVPGWYWWKGGENSWMPGVVLVMDGGDGLSTAWGDVEIIGGEWSGPLLHPPQEGGAG